MIEVIKFEVEHWHEIRAQETTAYLGKYISAGHVEQVAAMPHSFTGIVRGEIVAIAGVVEFWEGRAEAWAELAQVCKRDFISIHRAVRRFLEVCPFDRVEATVAYDFEEGHRWMRLLGFEMEAERMRKYLPNGKDFSLYARVR